MSRAAGSLTTALLVAMLLASGCVPVREEAPAPARPSEAYRLRALLPLDARGEAVLYGRLAGVGEETRGGVWHAGIVLVRKAYVDGTLSDVEVRAVADTATIVSVAEAGDVRDRLLTSTGALVRLAVRREQGPVLRAVSISAVTALPGDEASVDGVLGVPPGGSGTLRGSPAIDGVGASAGALRFGIERSVYGFPLVLRVPIPWDSSTVLVDASGTRRSLGEALRGEPPVRLGPGTEVRFRRGPDGLTAEEVVAGP